MALSIINNSTAIGAQGSVNNANNSLTKTIKALSTGLRINSASDDASGLAVSEKLRAQISGLNKAATNAQDAISMLQTAEGAMGSMTSMVQRIRELAVQAGDPAYTTNDRAMLQLEVDQLKDEIDRVSNSAEFNTKKLLNRPVYVAINNTSGLAGIAYWINQFYELDGANKIEKSHPVVAKVKEIIDKEYADGRSTVMGDDELDAILLMCDKEFHKKLLLSAR